MKMIKILSLVVIASMLLSVMPAFAQPAMTLQLSAYSGYVGDKVTATGTIVTFNGAYELYFDANKDGFLNVTVDPKIGSGTATGYSFSKEVTIPNAYADADNVWVYDVLAGTPQAYQVWYTVITKFILAVNPTSNYEGGAFTFTKNVTGGKIAWNNALDLRLRIKKPDATIITTSAILNVAYSALGFYSQSEVIGPQSAELVQWGTYTAYLDWSTTGVNNTATWPSAQQGVASTTFDVRLTTKLEYERTLAVQIVHLVPINTQLSKYSLTDPDGVETIINVGPYGAGTWVGPITVLQTYKNSGLGTWTIKLYNATGSAYYKTTTFKVIPSKIYVSSYWVTNPTPMRTQSLKWHFDLYYADGSTAVTALDLPGGYPYKVYYNGTLAAELTSDLLTDNVQTPTPACWEVDWKVPKDQKLGINYSFNLTTNAITDLWGNMGPSSNKASPYFEVIKATLTVSAVQLIYPLPGGSLQRTLTAKGFVVITYPDGSRYTADDYKWVNGTATSTGATYTYSNPITNYDSLVGGWVLAWKSSYNATLGTYVLRVAANQIKDKWDNYNPAASLQDSLGFNLVAAVITVTDFKTDNSAYKTDDVVTISFKASYPSGDPVTKSNSTSQPLISIYASDNALYKTKVAGYGETTGLWSAKIIIMDDAYAGTYTAKLLTNAVVDNALPQNKGPSADQKATFNVTRISLTDVYTLLKAMNVSLSQCCLDLKASIATVQTTATNAVTQATDAAAKATAAKASADAAKTSADSAATKADAAIAAANEAKTAASAAKTSADSAGSKADAAKTAADAAKAAAQAATDANNSQTTLIYAAIGAALVAAIAAIVALMQISRKIA